MLTKEEILKHLREHKTELQRRFPLKRLALFGSYARNEQTDTSDIDVLVEISEPVEELERLFNHKIDLVSKKGIKSHYLPYIEDDAIYV